MVAILMMSAKLATLGLLEIRVFWKKGFDNFCPWHHQRNFIMWFKLNCRCGHGPKFDNSSISIGKLS